jgi:RecB family exonuclease
MPGLRGALQNQTSHISPTLLESLARCPFRAIAERVWRLDSQTGDIAGRVNKFVGTITHRLLQTIFQPVMDIPDWPAAFLERNNLAGPEIIPLENLVNACWLENKDKWLAEATRLSADQLSQAIRRVESLLPNIAACLKNDIEAVCPTVAELAFLFPGIVDPAAKANSRHALADGWRRTVVGLEYRLGPTDLPLGDGKTMCVAGIADHIELWENSTNNISFLRVTDYKTTTKTRLNAYAADDAPFSSHLQTPLYIWLAMEAFSRSAASVLIPLRETSPAPFANHLKRLTESNSDGSQWQFKLARTLERLDARIERGDFPPTPGEHCRNCDYSALCARPVDIAAFDNGDEE